MERADRAIIMAAGLGERMRPVTLTTPKPLVRVHGVPIIETQIRALRSHGIRDIYVVTGHLGEQFRYLEAAFPGVRLVPNPDYDRGNNITSMYHVREHLGPCVVMDGDIIIRDPEVLRPEYEHSTYCCTWFDSTSTEWIFRHDENWRVTDCLEEGGTGWGLRSISFWTGKDARRLREQVERAYENGLRNNYWDYVPVIAHREDYGLHIHPISDEAILEIDTFEELCREDPSFRLP